MNLWIAPLLLVVMFLVAIGFIASLSRLFRQSKSRASGLDYETRERARMPKEIAEGQLVINEETLWRRGGRPIVAKTDQIFRTPEGLLVPVETKTRGHVSASDIVQLSVQGNVLAHQPSRPKVAGWGYLRLAKRGAKPFYRRVRLLPHSKIELLLDRWHALRAGKVVPTTNPAAYRCNHCALRGTCPDRAR